MDQAATAAMPYHGFDTEVYTLMIGSHGKRFNVQADILTQIPMFSDAVKHGKIKQDIPFTMLDCDPKAVATLLAFVRDGRLPALVGEVQKLADTGSLKNKISNLIMAYQLALDLKLEAAQNAIVDRICPLLASIGDAQLRPNSNQTESYRKSKVYLLISRQIAHQLQKQMRERIDIPSQDDVERLAEVVGSWKKTDLVVLMTHLLKPIEECPIEAAMRNPCLYHVHEQTERCPPTAVGEPGITTDLPCEQVVTTGNTTDAIKKKKRKKTREAKLPPAWIVDGAAVRRSVMQPDHSYIGGEASTSSTANSDLTRYTPQELADHLVKENYPASIFDSRHAKSSHDLVNEKTGMSLSQAGWSDLEGEDDESQYALTEILTPTSSSVSAAPGLELTPTPSRAAAPIPRSDMHHSTAVPHRNRRAFKYTRPERPARGASSRLYETDDMLDQILAIQEQEEAAMEAEREAKRVLNNSLKNELPTKIWSTLR